MIRYDILEQISPEEWQVDQWGESECALEEEPGGDPGWRIVPIHGDYCEITIESCWYEQKAEGRWDDLPRIAEAMRKALDAFEEYLSANPA